MNNKTAPTLHQAFIIHDEVYSWSESNFRYQDEGYSSSLEYAVEEGEPIAPFDRVPWGAIEPPQFIMAPKNIGTKNHVIVRTDEVYADQDYPYADYFHERAEGILEYCASNSGIIAYYELHDPKHHPGVMKLVWSRMANLREAKANAEAQELDRLERELVQILGASAPRIDALTKERMIADLRSYAGIVISDVDIYIEEPTRMASGDILAEANRVADQPVVADDYLHGHEGSRRRLLERGYLHRGPRMFNDMLDPVGGTQVMCAVQTHAASRRSKLTPAERQAEVMAFFAARRR